MEQYDKFKFTKKLNDDLPVIETVLGDQASDYDACEGFFDLYRIPSQYNTALGCEFGIHSKVFEVHKRLVKDFVEQKASTGVTADQTCIDSVHLVVPFVWKRTTGGTLLSRREPLALRLVGACEMLKDVFLSPDCRQYSFPGCSAASPASFTIVIAGRDY